jgi:O-antigen ligase
MNRPPWLTLLICEPVNLSTESEPGPRRRTVASREAREEGLPLALWWSRALLGLTLLAAPLAFGAVQPWAWALLVLLALLEFFLWGVGCVQSRSIKVIWSPIFLPALLFFLLIATQLGFHLTADSIGTRESLLKFFADMIFLFLAVQFWATASESGRRRIGLVVAIYAFALSFFAILQFFSSHGLIYWSVKSPGWTFGPYVNRDHYAGLMELMIPFGVVDILSRPRRDPLGILLCILVLLPVASVLLCGSRGGMVALIVEMLILAILIMAGAPPQARRRLAGKLLLGVVVAASVFIWMDAGGAWLRLKITFEAPYSSQAQLTFADREAATLDCLRIFRDHPWLGTGLGSFDSVFPRYQSFATAYNWTPAHNDFAQTLAETGLMGGILTVWALAVFLIRAFGSLRYRLERPSGWIQIGAALGCCGILVHSFVDFNLRIPANAAWFAVCAAVACMSIHSTSPGSRSKTWERRSSFSAEPGLLLHRSTSSLSE